ncbi:MAG: sigma-54 dependent transcriptional regulator [Elusimicrobia bacterium]|nr:sigma-54 dependent transcriptional regulator [Elusimicrobiota bacterium]MDA8243948.1 sigma-54 dependent transcriptional regulator [Elusimicrobiota bacterium]
MGNILIAEDDADTRYVLKAALESGRHNCAAAASGSEALSLAETLTFDAVILDLVLGDSDGLSVLEKLKSEDPGLPVVILTGHADVQSAVKAMKLGALDYLVKPFGNEELLLIIEKAVKERRLKREFDALRSHVKRAYGSEPVTGSSREIKNTAALARQVASTDLTVILSGPSGSGKEVWAREIHRLSSRGDSPFVALDCGALPENLVESELFGYERGAFTGADRRKPGLFEAAFGGTLFLDEIANLSPGTQAKLLRVLEERRIRHLGGKKDIPVDTRVIVAANRDLPSCIKEGAFREDLYHRLNQFTLRVPSLAERKEDIPTLAAYFLREAEKLVNKKIESISDPAMAALAAYSWPGNVRELKNVIIRAALLSGGRILPEHLALGGAPVPVPAGGADVPANFDLKENLRLARASTERRLIAAALAETRGNKLQAAKLLSIDRKALYNKLKEYSLE